VLLLLLLLLLLLAAFMGREQLYSRARELGGLAVSIEVVPLVQVRGRAVQNNTETTENKNRFAAFLSMQQPRSGASSLGGRPWTKRSGS
jgi:hypothetical protein